MKNFMIAILLVSLMPAAMATPEEEAAATKVLNEYLAAVTALDARRAASYFHEPFMLVNATSTTVYPKRADVESWIAPGYAALKERGFARSEWAKLKAKSLGNGIVIASALAVRYKTDAQELQRFGVTYLLRNTAEGWRLATFTVHDPASVLALE